MICLFRKFLYLQKIKIMTHNTFYTILLVFTVFIISCETDDKVVDIYEPKGVFDSGALVLNEGTSGNGNATVSFISFDLNTTQNNIFANTNNGTSLGDKAQSIAFKDDLAYIIVNNSNKIEIVNRNTMAKVASINSGLSNPRYMAFSEGKGYVTNWGVASNPEDDYIAVINLTTNSMSNKIPVIEGPERIIENAGKLFISHKGGLGYGNKISVVSASSNTVTNSINVLDLPNTMQIDNGFLWVLCEGKPSSLINPLEETSGSLKKINLATDSVESTFNFPLATNHPSNLVIVNSKLYYTINSSIYKMNLVPVAPATSISLPLTSAFTSSTPNLYGFAIKNNRIYISGFDVLNSNGIALIYSLGDFQDSQTIGTLLRTTGVGVAPNGFYFNQ